MRRTLLVSIALGALAAPAAAHLSLTQPRSRYGGQQLKPGPCGQSGGVRTQNVTTYAPGETIEVVFDEYVDHPGYFRIAFDRDGDDDFVDPACLGGCDTRNPTMEMYSNDAVLLDGIADRNGGQYRVMVTLPDVECDNCTLQVIQVMFDKPPQTSPGNDLYYQCADLVLRGEGPPPPPVVDVGPGAGPIVDAGRPPPPPRDAGGPGPRVDAAPPGPVVDRGAPPAPTPDARPPVVARDAATPPPPAPDAAGDAPKQSITLDEDDGCAAAADTPAAGGPWLLALLLLIGLRRRG